MRLPLLCLALLVAGCAGPAQTAGLDDAAAPSGATRVTATVDAPPGDAYRALARALQSEGWALDHSDAELRTVTTDYRTVSEGGFVYEMRVSGAVVAEGPARVEVRGWYRVPSFGDQEREVSKTGLGGSIPRRAWAHLYRVAEAVGGDVTAE